MTLDAQISVRDSDFRSEIVHFLRNLLTFSTVASQFTSPPVV